MGKRRIPVVRTYHIRYVADFLVNATNTKEAYARGDEELLAMMANESMDIDDIFSITVESDRFHMVSEDSGEDDADDGLDELDTDDFEDDEDDDEDEDDEDDDEDEDEDED